MRIAMVSEHASPLAVVGGVDAGGQNVHVAALSAALAGRGHEVVVYTRRDDPDLPDRVGIGPGVTVEHLDAGPAAPVAKDELLPHVPELARALALRLRTRPADVLHAHFWMSGMACDQALRTLRGPRPAFVQTFHALGAVKRRWLGEDDPSPAGRIDVEAALARRADRVVATCSDEVAELTAAGADRNRIEVAPCGVDIGHFTPDGPVAPRSGRPRLLALGRLIPRKGVDDAIAALAAPGLLSVADAELLVAGGPDGADLARDPEARRLLALAERLGVRSRVHLLGRVPRAELPALVRSADLALCLPWYEPFGIVPLEAMACGVPVIGTAVGGLLDSVADGVTGTLVPVRRPDLAAVAVEQLLGDPARRAAYGAAGVRRVRSRYAWASVAAATEASYLRAVQQRLPVPAPAPVPAPVPVPVTRRRRAARADGPPTGAPARAASTTTSTVEEVLR